MKKIKTKLRLLDETDARRIAAQILESRTQLRDDLGKYITQVKDSHDRIYQIEKANEALTRRLEILEKLLRLERGGYCPYSAWDWTISLGRFTKRILISREARDEVIG